MKTCKSCKTEIDERASKCPHCQADQRNWFMRHKILTGILALIVIGMVIGAGENGKKTANTTTSGQENTSSNVVTSTPQPTIRPKPIIVDAQTLVGEYDKNKLAAQDKYTGKLVQTAGYIKNISNDITGSYYLSLNPTSDQYYFGTSIQCYFKDKSALTALSNGQQVTVQGTMEDMSLGIVQMKDCNLVK